MQRTRVFIGYSKEDEEYLQAFLVHLKPWEEQGIVDVWSDQRIETSQDWHKEIQQALASAAVAVLLVSPDFLATDYIRHQELPYLLRTREDGEIDIACLYLWASTVDDDDSAIPVELSSGETLRIKLTKYQALNRPTAVLAALSDHERDALYASAASDLKRLYQRKTRRTHRTLTGINRHELTVQFRRRGEQLTRTYHHQYARIPEYRSMWRLPGHHSDDTALFGMLFGTQEQCDKVLRILFEVDPARKILTRLISRILR